MEIINIMIQWSETRLATHKLNANIFHMDLISSKNNDIRHALYFGKPTIWFTQEASQLWKETLI